LRAAKEKTLLKAGYGKGVVGTGRGGGKREVKRGLSLLVAFESTRNSP